MQLCVIFVKLCVTSTSYTEFHRDHTELHRGLFYLLIYSTYKAISPSNSSKNAQPMGIAKSYIYNSKLIGPAFNISTKGELDVAGSYLPGNPGGSLTNIKAIAEAANPLKTACSRNFRRIK